MRFQAFRSIRLDSAAVDNFLSPPSSWLPEFTELRIPTSKSQPNTFRSRAFLTPMFPRPCRSELFSRPTTREL